MTKDQAFQKYSLKTQDIFSSVPDNSQTLININQCLAQGGQVLQSEVIQKQGGKQEAINTYCAQVPEIVQTARAIKAQLEGGGNFQ